MRVLWFTNGPMPAAARRSGTRTASGYWMSCLLEHVRRAPGVELAVAAACPGLKDDQFVEDGVEYFIAGQPKYQSIFSATKKDLEQTAEIVRQVNPDLVHIHGSERFYGLLAARRMIAAPAVISIQGLLQICVASFFGALSPGEILECQRLIELATRRGVFWRYQEFRAGARQEREILAGCGAFMGRTDWDREAVMAHNPRAKYYQVGEILRAPFREACWDLDRCERNTIIFTHPEEPRRGADVLVRALPIVRRRFPDAKLLLAGSLGDRHGHDRFVRRLIRENGLAGSVEMLGYLNAETMVRQLCRAHLFAQPSFVENSSNSLCEAMQTGLPVVGAYAGGTPSIASYGRAGLLVPPGDPASLAAAIVRVFENDELAISLGSAARAAASERHAPELVVSQLLGAYKDVFANDHNREFARTASQI